MRVAKHKSLIFLILLTVFFAPFENASGSPLFISSDPAPTGTEWVRVGPLHILLKIPRLPDGEVGTPYQVKFSTDSSHRIFWKVDGDLPPGLGISPSTKIGLTLTLSGTPSTAGQFIFSVNAREEIFDGVGLEVTNQYVLHINPPTVPIPPSEPIRFDLGIYPYSDITVDLAPFVSGAPVDRIMLGTGESVPSHIYLWVRKSGGSDEPIALRQSGLPEGLEMMLGGVQVTTSSSDLVAENLLLTDEINFEIILTARRAILDRMIRSAQTSEVDLIRFTVTSQSGVTKWITMTIRFSFSRPKLEISNLQPLSQHGSVLIGGKQTIFKFEYRLDYSSPISVDYKLDLGRALCWMEPPESIYSSEDWYWSYAGLREEGGSLVYYGSITLVPTTEAPGTVYLMEEFSQGNGFLPRPEPDVDLQIRVDVDPLGRVEWADGSALVASGTFRCVQYAYYRGRWIKALLFEHVGGGFGGAVRQPFRFNADEWREYLDHICNPIGSVPERYYNTEVLPYDVYLSGLFKDFFHVHCVTDYYWAGVIGWWDADTIAEEAADEGYERVVAIVPPEALGSDTLGVVYNADYHFWDQGFHTAFVDYTEAMDSGRYLYFPVIAHELSHTYRFPDIYDGYAVVVPSECVYFDEFNGGIIKIFKNVQFSDSDIRRWDYGEGELIRMTSPSDVAARDIMDKGGLDRSEYWAWASWKKVAHLGDEDPPEGLLISMIIFRNGTVLGRPFQKIYNHSWTYPRTDAIGNFTLTLYLRNGQIFKRIPYNMSFYYFVDPGGSVLGDAIPFVRLVDWSDDLGRIELRDSEDRVWFTRDVSAHAPVLEIVSPPEWKKLGIGHNYTLIWSGTDADGDPLWYTVLMRRKGDDVWSSLASRITEDQISLDSPRVKLGRSDFPEGDYEIQIKATDGVNTAVKVISVSIVEEVRTYTLTVESNIGVSIPGSGIYEEGDVAQLKASREVPSEGFFGLIGAVHRFSYWKGFVESKDSDIAIRIEGDQTDLRVTAIYEADYSRAYFALGLGALVIILMVAVFLILRGRTGNLPPPPTSRA